LTRVQHVTTTAVTGLLYAEGLRWHEGALWFSDMLAHQVLRYRPGAGTDVIADLRSPSGIGFAPDGAAYVVCRDEDALYRVAPGPVELVADLAAIGMLRANDMVVDGAGRCFIGCLGKEYDTGDEFREWDDQAPGRVAFLDLSGAAPFSGTIVAEGLGCPNGMVIGESGDVLYLAETYGKRVLAYRIGAHGALTDRRVVARFDTVVDGLAGDGDGLWVAAGPRFARLDAAGRTVDEIAAPAGWTAITCALGGTTGRTLFMAVAIVDMEEFVAGRSSSEILSTEVPELAAGSR
jgi:sugar lactone lactonase YvrE